MQIQYVNASRAGETAPKSRLTRELQFATKGVVLVSTRVIPVFILYHIHTRLVSLYTANGQWRNRQKSTDMWRNWRKQDWFCTFSVLFQSKTTFIFILFYLNFLCWNIIVRVRLLILRKLENDHYFSHSSSLDFITVLQNIWKLFSFKRFVTVFLHIIRILTTTYFSLERYFRLHISIYILNDSIST